MALGEDVAGRPVFGDLAKMPHLLIAGATGTGKSVCVSCIIASLLARATPDQVELLLIDTKRVELTVYNGIPHLKSAVIADPVMAADALALMTREMDLRYERFATAGARTMEEYNAKRPDEKIPYGVIVVDELADLMLVAPVKVETSIVRLARDGRATGLHLVIATSRSLSDVIASLVKANMRSRIAFKVTSHAESQAILDVNGAEHLLGRGDMLYFPLDAPKPIRAQGALVTRHEIDRLIAFWKRQQPRPSAAKTMAITPLRDDEGRNGSDRRFDDLWYDAAKFLFGSRVAKGDPGVGSTAALQARFSIGHPRAVRLMRHLEELGIVGPNEGTQPRNVTIDSLADLDHLAKRLSRPDGSGR
jgi:S-DNA-T family DNA segregation ATPase FtsK/SpoIIIE